MEKINDIIKNSQKDIETGLKEKPNEIISEVNSEIVDEIVDTVVSETIDELSKGKND